MRYSFLVDFWETIGFSFVGYNIFGWRGFYGILAWWNFCCKLKICPSCGTFFVLYFICSSSGRRLEQECKGSMFISQTKVKEKQRKRYPPIRKGKKGMPTLWFVDPIISLAQYLPKAWDVSYSLGLLCLNYMTRWQPGICPWGCLPKLWVLTYGKCWGKSLSHLKVGEIN